MTTKATLKTAAVSQNKIRRQLQTISNLLLKGSHSSKRDNNEDAKSQDPQQIEGRGAGNRKYASFLKKNRLATREEVSTNQANLTTKIMCTTNERASIEAHATDILTGLLICEHLFLAIGWLFSRRREALVMWMVEDFLFVAWPVLRSGYREVACSVAVNDNETTACL